MTKDKEDFDMPVVPPADYVTSEDAVPPFSHLAEKNPRKPAVVRVVKPAPLSREEVRARLAARVAPQITAPTSDYYQMPVERLPIDPPALAHMRKPRATSVVSVKPAPQPQRKPKVRTRSGVGTVAGAVVDAIIGDTNI